MKALFICTDQFDYIHTYLSNTENQDKSIKGLRRASNNLNFATSKKIKFTRNENVVNDRVNQPKPDEKIPIYIPNKQNESDYTAQQENSLFEPMPNKAVKNSMELYFLKNFKKDFRKMTRDDLEELILKKVVEAIDNKSVLSELRHRTEIQELEIQKFQTTTKELTKQFLDLEMIHQTVLSKMNVKNYGVILPVKLQNNVGIQVNTSKKPKKIIKTVVACTQTSPNRSKQELNVAPPMTPSLSDQQQQQIQNNKTVKPQKQAATTEEVTIHPFKSRAHASKYCLVRQPKVDPTVGELLFLKFTSQLLY